MQLSKDAGFRCAPTDIRGLPGVEMDIRVEGDHIWMRVNRLEGIRPPKPSDWAVDLFRISDSPSGAAPAVDEAALQRRINGDTANQPPERHEEIETDLRSRSDEALLQYCQLWEAWAAGERPRRKTISLYGDLFALKHQVEAEETAKPTEVVWGIGIATWEMSFDGSSFPFEYPMLTQAVEIAIDSRTMALEVRPRATNTRFEMDVFVACQVIGAADIERSGREHLARQADRPVSPFDPGSYADVLKLAATNLDSEGAYQEVLASGDPIPKAGPHLVVTDSWMLFPRRRTNNYLIEDLARLQTKIRSGCEIPAGPLALVSPPSNEAVIFEPVNFRGISSRGSSGHGQEPEELYFPLAYNTEQVTIVHRLKRAAGVTVQGPPGTGKTHTIANIICHYLATGKRVLVTSRGEPALKVLQSKIPEEVRSLTVALLTNDREGMRQFQASIESIQHRVSQLIPEETQQQIHVLRQAIGRAHAELGAIDRRVDEIALSQLSEIEVDGVFMRAQKMAELVMDGEAHHNWFDDVLSLAAEHAPPLNDAEAGRLRECRRKLGRDLCYVHSTTPNADELPTPEEIAELHNVLVQMKQADQLVRTGEILALKSLTQEVVAAARDLLADVERARTLAEEIESFGAEWPHELRTKCRLPTFAAEREALEALFDDIDRVAVARAEILKRPIVFPEEALTLPKVREAVVRGAQTGKPFAMVALGVADAKQHLSMVRVAGLAPTGSDDWAHIQKYLDLHIQIISLVARWNEFAVTLSLPQLVGGIGSLRHIEVTAMTARKAHQLATAFDTLLPKRAERVFELSPTRQLLGRSDDLQSVYNQLWHHVARADLSKAAASLSTLQGKLAGKDGPVSATLRSLIEDDLGNPGIDANQVIAKFAGATAELRRLAGLSVELATVRDHARLFAGAGAVKLATRLCNQPVGSNGEDTTFPAGWQQARTWARIRAHLGSIDGRQELLTMGARRRSLEDGLARLYRDVVSKAAWLATKKNATPLVLQALAGYATAIRRIGQGTGPNAIRYRRDARESMYDAAGAVPCWIMSHAKISESMPADIGTFDLVIVDEASQSDLWALPAIVRGKKILVVGDDKQVSPDGGFISSQRINDLKNRFLADQPFGVEMTPEKSLYDLAARVFAAEQVMLREHFRCVPAIIAYSNRVFYKGGIQPLRIPKASERIDPPLVDIHVPNGMRDRHDRNRLEAEVIAAEISSLIADPCFDNRSIGVVSLLGMDQAKYVDTVVRERCRTVDLMSRNFECGDARTFQGSERDIMFLSMVVDPINSRAIAGNMYEQRFNVAASRARDRMYLVRSVSAADLSEKDLRLTLLRHFDKPVISDDLEADNLIDKCESGFERDVFLHLMKNGYRVIPQVKTGAYRIDMVVEGADDMRLAIECDGDEFHGPDRWQHDMNRQRVLERAGWTFWRCFASTWSLRKEEVFGELRERLAAMGIEPIGSMDRVPSLVEKRTWHPPATEGSDEVDAVLNAAVAAA
jgi:very-short-patch-repair endonuclease